MDLIPKPDQIVAASANVAQKVLYGGLADLRPMPRTLIDAGTAREVHHYRPLGRVDESGDPVLLVAPLAAPSLCYDLRRGCSLAEHLVTGGRRTYLVEYGRVSFEDPGLDMEPWVTDIVPEAIRQVSRHSGGRPVHVVGWSMGGTFALLTAAARSTLPIASVTAFGAPIDVEQVPLVAPVRPFLGVDGDQAAPIALATRVIGGMPQPLSRRVFQLSAFNKLVAKPFAQLAKLDDADFLAQLEAVDRFTATMAAYPGRTFGRLYHRMLQGSGLATGTVRLGGRDLRLADINVPVLAFGGASDTIAPVTSVRPVEELATGAPELRFEVVPGGHLGMLTGRTARDTTWRILDQFLARHTSDAAEREPQAPATAVPRSPSRARKATAGTRTETPRSETSTIGTNPERRFRSAGSRSLSGRPAGRGRDTA